MWGSAFSLSMLIVAVFSPVLGAAADYGAGKKRFLGILTAICVLATSSLFFVHAGMIFWGMALLIVSNIGFEAGLVFYDAFLPEITTPRSYGRVSGYGFALGYVGSLVSLATVFPLYVWWIRHEQSFQYSAKLHHSRCFLFCIFTTFVFLSSRQTADRQFKV